MKRLLKSIVVGVAGLAMLSGVALAQDKPEKTDITIGLAVTVPTMLPVFLALDEGYFKEEGLNVKIIAFSGGTDLVRAMIAGSVDVGLSGLASVTVGIKADQPLKVFYGGFNMVMFEWYAVKGITSLADTKGKRFGVARLGSSTDVLTRYALKKNGIDPKSVQIVQGGESSPRLAAMEAGQLDVNILEPPATYAAADRGLNLIFKQSDIAPDSPYHTFFATEDFIKKDPNTVRALLRGFIKGVRRAKADKERSVKLLEDRIKLSKDYSARTYDNFIGQIYEDGRMPSDAGMQSFWEIGIMAGDFTEPWPKDRYLDSTFIDSYNQWKPAE